MKTETIYFIFYKNEFLNSYYAIIAAYNGKKIVKNYPNIPSVRCDGFIYIKNKEKYIRGTISSEFINDQCDKISADTIWNECPEIINNILSEFSNMQRTKFGISVDSGRVHYMHMIKKGETQ